ncbi:MAG: hypothetical protein ABRQ26_06660 [Syntrophomonadaceae bacterium]
MLLVDNGFQENDDITLLKVPGHTKRQQAIAVETRAGTYVLVGDLLYTMIIIYPSRPPSSA